MEKPADDFAPPAEEPVTGVPLDAPEGLPINHRLRAEALVKSGASTDPGGQISDEFIAETAERLAAEEAGAEADRAKAEATDPVNGSVSDLRKHIESVADTGELSDMRTREVSGQNRKSALDALDARIAALAVAPPPPPQQPEIGLENN